MSAVLNLYNTATRQKEACAPVDGAVGMYCCGPTVYNFAHIGNLRTYIFEDVLRRTLEALGCTVNHVVNITDVGHLVSDADEGEDKMEKGARREKKSVWEIARFYTDAFMEDIRQLNILSPTTWCRATDHIQDMIEQVRQLEEKDFTYKTSDGIYFDTSAFPRYGDFAGLDPEQLRAGSRVDMGEKKNPTDFALWKFSPADHKRQMEWESPWGVGFPGWHVECSAMALKYLPQPIDIHCGGMDHVRVHHSNEIAQAEAATGKPFVRRWVHGEFLVMDKGKMAKSGDGFITLTSLAEEGFDPLAYRMFCFTAHYRSPLSFSREALRSAAASLENLRRQIAVKTASAYDTDRDCSGDPETVLEDFRRAVCDDLNMPRALAALQKVLKSTEIPPSLLRAAVARADEILGLDLFAEPGGEKQQTRTTSDGRTIIFTGAGLLSEGEIDEIAHMIQQRQAARKNKDFSTADALRDELAKRGVELKDMPDGSSECRIVPQ